MRVEHSLTFWHAGMWLNIAPKKNPGVYCKCAHVKVLPGFGAGPVFTGLPCSPPVEVSPGDIVRFLGRPQLYRWDGCAFKPLPDLALSVGAPWRVSSTT